MHTGLGTLVQPCTSSRVQDVLQCHGDLKVELISAYTALADSLTIVSCHGACSEKPGLGAEILGSMSLCWTCAQGGFTLTCTAPQPIAVFM